MFPGRIKISKCLLGGLRVFPGRIFRFIFYTRLETLCLLPGNTLIPPWTRFRDRFLPGFWVFPGRFKLPVNDKPQTFRGLAHPADCIDLFQLISCFLQYLVFSIKYFVELEKTKIFDMIIIICIQNIAYGHLLIWVIFIRNYIQYQLQPAFFNNKSNTNSKTKSTNPKYSVSKNCAKGTSADDLMNIIGLMKLKLPIFSYARPCCP